MKKLLFLSLLSAMAVLSGCGSSSDEEATEPVAEQEQEAVPEVRDVTRGINLTESQKAAVGRNNDFAFNIYRAISQSEGNETKSLVFSPVSCTYALGLLNDGARGQTSAEILSLLGFGGGTAKEVNELCQTLILESPLVDEQVVLKLANTVVANADITLSEKYSREVKAYYQAETFSKDFADPSTLTFVNGWCSSHTEGKIEKILDELDPDTKALLMNAVYFKAPWAVTFDKSETADEPFTCDDGRRVSTTVMHRLGALNYTRNATYATVALPYGKGDRWTMYVLLPEPGKSVADVLGSLTQSSWEENKSRLVGTKVDVKLPRFKTESDLGLTEIVNSLGARTMFTNAADFSLMTADGRPLKVSKIKQKAVAEVSEEGTEAAAVTVIEMIESAMPTGEPVYPEFHATRPFVYLIQEETSGAVFFIGTYRGE